MLEGFRRLVNTRVGRVAASLLALAVVAGCVYAVMGFLQGDTPASARERMYVCTETGKSFAHEPQRGETLPLLSPFTGRNTAMPGEACYWTAAGTPKDEPTWVLLNEYAKKPGPTFCPDCGRLVVGHNPPAAAGRKPPPTQAEYKPREPRKPAAGAGRDDR